MKCCIVAIYQCKKLKQNEFPRIVLSEARARFDFFPTFCKGKVKEMVTRRFLGASWVRFSKRQYVVMFCILSDFENDSVWKVTQLHAFQSVEMPISFAGLYLEFRRPLKIVCKSYTPIATKVCFVFMKCNFIIYAIFLEFVNCISI